MINLTLIISLFHLALIQSQLIQKAGCACRPERFEYCMLLRLLCAGSLIYNDIVLTAAHYVRSRATSVVTFLNYTSAEVMR